MRNRILFSAALVGVLLLVFTAPAWAGDELIAAFTEGETEQEEVVEDDPGSELGIEPAVPAAPEEEEVEERPWTQRFLAPAVLVLGVVGLIGAVVYYAARVRGKYKVAHQ